ncbi:MAG TPA: DUF559 domain-containing protein [Bacteroidales bacterium]|nr:DUF559 domain-containing protein [Bacteroidales bacterium]
MARSFRKEATEAEDILWNEIRNKRIKGFKFRSQHPLSNYIADFYCHEARLVIEVDGEIHEHSKEYDECRSYMLSELGIKVIRFKNDEIVNDLNSVISRIYLEL